MKINEFYERESLKNKISYIMKHSLDLTPREEIVEASTERISLLFQDIMEKIRDKNNDGETNSLIIFDTLMHSIMMQDILIQLQEEELKKLRKNT